MRDESCTIEAIDGFVGLGVTTAAAKPWSRSRRQRRTPELLVEIRHAIAARWVRVVDLD